MVSYEILWEKLQRQNISSELVTIFKYWYDNQINIIKWADCFSDEYKLECGVRQGGISSPTLFNVYINSLIAELSSMHAGCYIDGIAVNNLSYADDMVLLSPSISALRKMLNVCEQYTMKHGLKYNTNKSEFMFFGLGGKNPTIPPIMLYGVPINRVAKFKYLGHIITDDLKDNADIERERRALAVRGNMLSRRFARCSTEVKITLFKAYCQSFYTSSLWVNYTQQAYSALRVQYNNVFRMLLRLPRFCSASTMFAGASTDDLYAIRRKRIASLLHRLRGSSNSILKMLCNKFDSPILCFWTQIVTGALK
ncbi:uncharacterized protein LOC131849827 [Achroia grisella]|uniref:uncharacterized protein LOC131849827 n=1 Tax=Achroia grisella TaxID=688607 RepID=UPI0027D33BC6|nr:uncharacterized protein LOC131849827 [Achroia grisella]